MLKTKTKIILLVIFSLTICLIFYNAIWLNRTPKFKFTEFRNIDKCEYTNFLTSNILDVNDKEVLYAIGEDDKSSRFMYHHSLKLESLSNGSSITLTAIKDYTYVINAKKYLDGYLMSYVTINADEDRQVTFDFYLVYLNDGKEILLDSYQGDYGSNNYLDFKILGNNIVYTKSPTNQVGEIVIYNYKLDTRNIIKLEGEFLLDTDIKSAGNLIAYFVDMGDQDSFFVYDTVSKEKTQLPFDIKYRLYDYELTSSGIIASIASEPSSDYTYADDKKAILFIPLSGEEKIVDVNSRFFLTSNGKTCIGMSDKDKLFVFNFNKLEVTPIEMGDVGNIYNRPVGMYTNKSDFYIKSSWVYKNYDTEEKIVKITPY